MWDLYTVDMIEVKIVFADNKQIEKVREFSNESLTFSFIDITTKEGKKKGLQLKNYWGASRDPFAIVFKDGNPIKAFYSETINVPEELFNYLINKEYET